MKANEISQSMRDGGRKPIVQSYRDLEVYEAAFRFQQEVFRVSKKFPREENFSLTDQVRRSSRSIGANLAEAWAKRRYPAHFLSKLTDSDGELQENAHWIESAIACEYISTDQHSSFCNQMSSIGAMLGRMMATYLSFCHPTR